MTLMPTDKAETAGPEGNGHAPKLSTSGYACIVLERLARHACRVTGASWACLFVRDRHDPRLVIAAAGHDVGWELIGSRFGADEDVVGDVLLSGETAVVDDVRNLAASLPIDERDGVAGAAVPIWIGQTVAGVLAAAATDSASTFTDADVELLVDLSELAAAALEHADARDHDEGVVRAHVDALAAAMDARDCRTARHSEDVVALARRVGELLMLEAASLLELEFAARLHDVGKIWVPDAVLNKPGPLDADESATIRRHATWGSEALARVPGLQAIATIVRFHHERWDGAGYPDGLAAARIPLASRIISVCDAFGAMVTDRPYRGAMPDADALAEIHRGAGTQFDPAVVEALVEVVAPTAVAAGDEARPPRAPEAPFNPARPLAP